MKGIIMAGGEGSRLRPLTCCLPKPLAPVMGVPVMEHIVELLKSGGITQIGVTLQYLPSMITSYFEEGQNWDVNMRYFIEDKPLGTAGSVKNAGDFIDDTFIVISGDALTNIDLSKAVEFHRKKNAKVTIILKKVETPLEYGVVVTGENSEIVRFLEKPSWSEVFSDTVNTGIYIIEPDIMNFVKPGENFDFSKDLFPMLMEKNIPMYGYETEQYWCDIGDIEAYAACHEDVLNKKIALKINAKEVESGIFVGQNVVIEKGALIQAPVYIGSGTVVKNSAIISPYTVIGSDCIIEEGAYIEKGILWNNVHVMSYARINSAIVCDKAVLKNNCFVDQSSVIGKGAIIGSAAVVHSGLKVWNEKEVEDNCEIDSNLVWGTKYGRVAFDEHGIIGNVNIDITPETIAKIAGVYACVQSQNGKIAVSTDNHNSSVMIKHSMISGLLAGGMQVLDFGQQPIPITRAGVKFYGLSGGIHISGSNGKAMISMLGSSGANISRQVERKIENLISRGDYVRIRPDTIKEAVSISSYRLYYLRDVVNKCKNSRLGYHILLNIKNPLNKSLIISLLSDLSCRYTIDSESIEMSDSQSVKRFVQDVKKGGFDMGAYIDDGCENLVLCDNLGRVISDDMFDCCCAYITFMQKPGSVYVAGLAAPRVIETMATNLSGQVLRTKSSPIEVMARIAEDTKDVSLSSQFVLNFDAIGGLVMVMDFLKTQNITLAELVENIPSFYIAKDDAYCDYANKGLIIRRIMEESRDKNVELTEGVKIYENDGWVLVLPDARKPSCKVISEGLSQEFAMELTATYIEKIKKML